MIPFNGSQKRLAWKGLEYTNKITPTANGRIPAIVDKTSGKPKRVFEGASMQLYLCEKYDKDHKISFPYDNDEYWETVEWLVWMVSLKSH